MTQQPMLVLTTGGTIDKAYFDALSEYQIVESGIPALLKEARVALPFRVVELMRKDSLDLTEADRQLIASADGEPSVAFVVVAESTPGYRPVLTAQGYKLVNEEGEVVYTLTG